MKDYIEFLKDKMAISHQTGFEVKADELTPYLYPHVKDTVRWAVSGGCRAIFSSFGMQKTVTQLEILRVILNRTGGKGLIVCPKRVVVEFLTQAEKHLGMKVTYVRTMQEVKQCPTNIMVTNYERVRDGEDGVRIEPSYFTVTSLDEASVLRGFGTKTYQEFLPMFAEVPYRFVATATPSPNRYKELIHYAGYLGVMDTGQALTRFFQRDSTKANNLTLYPHKEKEFWLWISTWALFLTKPSDLCYPDTGYELPELRVHEEVVSVDNSTAGTDRDGQVKMFREAALGLVDAAKERRDNMTEKIARVVEIINRSENKDDHFLLWHDLEAEREALCKAIPGCKAVYGSQDDEEADRVIADFKDGRLKYLAAKPEMLGEGLNFQYHCHKAIMFIDYRFNDKFQAIARIYRFMQQHPVDLYLVYAESEGEIYKSFMQKWAQHRQMVAKMTDIVRENGLFGLQAEEKMMRWMFASREEKSGKLWKAINNDNVLECQKMEDNSVDLIVTSIPFSNHYEYTPCYDEQTEILTNRGFISFESLTMQDEIATINPKTLKLEYQRPTHTLWKQYNGNMYSFNDTSFDLLVTPDHNMFVANRVGNSNYRNNPKKFELVRADKCYQEYKPRKYQMLASAIGFDGKELEYIKIPKREHRIMPSTNIIDKIQSKDFMMLAGWYISEGSCRDGSDRERIGEVTITQCENANSENRKEIIALLERIGLKPNTKSKGISFWNINIASFLRDEFGRGSYNKRIPVWCKNLSVELLSILRDTMMKGDGNSNGMAYTSFSKQLQDDFQEICFKTGWRTCLSEKFNTIRISQNRAFPEIRTAPQKINYSGMIGCATVPNHTLVVRRNGKIIVSGNCYNDFGHNEDNDKFFEQMDYLTPELMRILKPGRLACIHVKDRVLFGNATGDGMPTIDPFSEMTVFHYLKHGFRYMGRITVDTDVVRENNQTYRLGYTEMCKDGSKMGIGCPEYVLLFRKLPSDTSRAYADLPVTKNKSEYSLARWQIDAHASWKSSGNSLLSYEDMKGAGIDKIRHLFRNYEREHIYNYEEHVSFAEELEAYGKLPKTFMAVDPVSKKPWIWDDVTRMRTLNTKQSQKKRQNHICPLQLDIVERLIERYSNKGELVFDPFGGIGTVPYCAIRLGRRGLSTELNYDYWKDSLSYLYEAEMEVSAPTLFDLMDSAV